MQRLLEDAAHRASRYFESLTDRAVRPDPAAVQRLAELDIPLPAEGVQGAEVLKLLDERVGPATMAMAGRRFFGFVIGGALPVTVAANWLATAWDQNTGLYRSTPGTSHLEQVALAWLKSLFGFPPSTAGAFVTGGTMANFTALAAARHAVLQRAGWDVEADGLFGAPPITVLVGAEAHPTLLKSLGLLGLGRNRVVRVPVDAQGRMRADALPKIDGPTIVCVQAGNVNTGAFDPLEPLIAAREGRRRVGARRRRVRAVGRRGAESCASDGRHRGRRLLGDRRAQVAQRSLRLRARVRARRRRAARRDGDHRRVSADGSPQRNPSDFTPELSRRARGVEVWAALLSLGRTGVAELIERNCRQARRFAEVLSNAGHRILNDVVFNQVLVSFGSAETTLRVIDAIQEDGTCWCGGTVWQGPRPCASACAAPRRPTPTSSAALRP